MGIAQLISDLGIMMLTAGIITIVFKKIKQPLILGYILAGFLLSPYFPWFSTIVDTEGISTWSEIGIIFLMFHLGLEFNMHKLAEVGSTAILTCVINLVGMMGVGYITGTALGFSSVDSLVLGGMLSMSSTMVIIKVFDESKINGPYTGGVFGTLVIQDIVGIFMMVIMSTVAVSKGISGLDMALQLSTMLLYLVVWLILGIFILPTFFDKTIKYMNDEMLIIISVGICLGMVLLAGVLGFSSALGAFLSGSLMAGTVHVERVETLTKPIKDMFGAVFFVSVGMLVSPAMIVKYIVPILVITAVTIVGKILFNGLGMLAAGQSLDNSIKSGFALAQIGEFAFIIAGLGSSLGLTEDFLYPIMVAVSVITTFTTPICIKAAPKFSKWFSGAMPSGFIKAVDKYTSDDQTEKEKDSDLSKYIKQYFLRIVIFGGLMLAASIVFTFTLKPFLAGYIGPSASAWVSIAAIYIAIALFSGPMLNLHDSLYTSLWLKGRMFQLPLTVMNLIKYFLITAIAMIPLWVFFTIHPIWLAAICATVLIVLSRKSFMATWYLKLENRFLKNFNERLLEEEEMKGRREEWLDQKLYIHSFKVEDAENQAEFVGKKLADLNWGKWYNVYIVKIQRGDKQLLLPGSQQHIKSGDKVYIIGEESACNNFCTLIGDKSDKPLRSLKQFMSGDYEDVENALAFCPIKLTGDEAFAGKPIKQGKVKDHWHCFIIGMQQNGFPIIMPDPNHTVEKDDILWIMGSSNNVGRIVSNYIE